MKIKAGMQEIAIQDLRVSGNYAVLTLDGEALITPEQMQALKSENWSVYAESESSTQPDEQQETQPDEQQETQPTETLLSEYSGYNEPLEFSLTMKRGVALQNEVSQQRETLAEMAQSLPDEAAVQYKEYFDEWEAGLPYKAGRRVKRKGLLYKVLQAHTSQADWAPESTPSLYTVINDPNVEDIPAWVSGRSYAKDVKVRHKAKVWISGVDANVWEPGAPGVYENIWAVVK